MNIKNKTCVTHITTVHPTFDTRIFHKQCRSLSKRGININLIVSHDKKETINGVHIIPLPVFKGRVARMLIKPIVAFVYSLKTRADLYHFHDPELIPIGMLLKLFGKKVVYDVHEDVSAQILSKYWIPSGLRKVVSFFFKWIESFCCIFFDGVVAATPHIRSKFLKKNNNTIDINNYVLLEEVINYRIEKNISEKKDKIICYVGSITKERGIFELLKAIQETDITLYLAGTTSPKNLLKVLEKEEGWKNVVYFGQVGREEMGSILLKAQVGICLFHPMENHMNCIPNKLFEYMGASLPIVASNFPFWRKLLSDIDNVCFVDPLDPEKIRDTINNITSDRETCKSMGERGLKAVNEIYNWGKEEKKLIDFYKHLGVIAE